MASPVQDMIAGYTQKVLGTDSGASKAQSAQQTATAYQQLQDAIASDYNSQKQQFEADPANKGQSWKAPDTTERFNDQVQAMIYSGDPALQSRGLALLDNPKEESTTTLEKTANLLNLTPMQVFQMQHPGPASTRINVNLPKMDQPMSIEDLQKLQFPAGVVPIPGMSMREAGEAGGRIGQTKEQSDKGSAAEISANAITQLGDNLNPTNSVKDTIVETLRNAPGIPGQIASVAATAAGIPTNQSAVKFTQSSQQAAAQMLKILSGASATDEEFQRIQNLFPQIGHSPATKAIKYNSMLDQTEAIVNRAKSQGVTGLPDISKIPRVRVPAERKPRGAAAPVVPQAPKAPETRTTKSGLTYTVEK